MSTFYIYEWKVVGYALPAGVTKDEPVMKPPNPM